MSVNMHRFICHSGDSTLKCTPMKFGLIWRALIRSGHVLTLWIMKSSLYRKPWMRTCALMHVHTQPNSIYTQHMQTQACIHPPTKKMDRTPGGIFNDASRLCFPLFFSSLFLPSLSFVWPTERCVLTGIVVWSQQTCNETCRGGRVSG